MQTTEKSKRAWGEFPGLSRTLRAFWKISAFDQRFNFLTLVPFELQQWIFVAEWGGTTSIVTGFAVRVK